MQQGSLVGVVTAPDDEARYEKLIVRRALELGWIDFHVERVPVRRPGTSKTVWMTPTNRKGWPDRTLMHPDGWVLILEVKGKDGVLKPEQRDVLKVLQEVGKHTGERFAAFAVWPRDWPAVEQWLMKPHRASNVGT
jgi:hypothetical protein